MACPTYIGRKTGRRSAAVAEENRDGTQPESADAVARSEPIAQDDCLWSSRAMPRWRRRAAEVVKLRGDTVAP